MEGGLGSKDKGGSRHHGREVLSKSDGGGGCGRWRMMNVCMSDSQTLILGKFLRAGILFHRLR